MASFSIQFHAALPELADFVDSCLEFDGVHAIAVHTPFRIEKITRENVHDALAQESVRSVVFTEGPPNMSATTGNRLLDMNVGCLVLDVGRLREHVLEESCLNTMQAGPTWRRLGAELKRRTAAGVVGLHETTGASAMYRDHRYTAGAKALFQQGIALRQFAQSPVLLRPGF